MKTEEKKKDLCCTQVIMHAKHIKQGNCYFKIVLSGSANILEDAVANGTDL